MANLAVTITTQVISVFGSGPTTKWGAFQWGDLKWGNRLAGPTQANHMILGRNKVLNQALTVTYAQPERELSQGVYYYEFIDHVSNIESAAASSTYTIGSTTSVSYTSGTGQSTTWS